MIVNLDSADVIINNAEHHQHNIDWFSPCIKNKTADQKYDIFPRFGNQEVNDQRQRKKYKNKENTAKYPGILLPFIDSFEMPDPPPAPFDSL